MPKQYSPPNKGPYHQTTLRLPQRLYERYKKRADRAGISLNLFLINQLEGRNVKAR